MNAMRKKCANAPNAAVRIHGEATNAHVLKTFCTSESMIPA